MEQLVEFGRALGESLSLDSIAEVATKYFPRLADGRLAWAMVRRGHEWHPLAVTGDRTIGECERTARIALGDTAAGAEGDRGDMCFPMLVAGEAVGVFGVAPDPPLPEPQRVALAAAAALLAVSVKNADLFHKLHETSVRDSLTGCANRAHAMAVIEAELSRSRRAKVPLSLIMFDLDHFKQINDQFGHLCGDAVLMTVGERLNETLRGGDLKCRYGGEEFLILLPDTTLAGAERAAEQVRGRLEERAVSWNDQNVQVTASFGLTAALPDELNVAAIIGRADEALYRAKASGRNRVCVG